MTPQKSRSTEEILAEGRRRAAEALARSGAAMATKMEVAATQKNTKEVGVFIRGLDARTHAMPNRLAESSLFAPIAKVSKQMRPFLREALLVSRQNAEITYTGEQNNEEDADIFCELIAAAFRGPGPLGSPVVINRAEFLRAIGRDTGKAQYDWLNERIRAFTVATLFIKIKRPDGTVKKSVGGEESLHLVDKYKFDEETGFYTFTIDKRWAELYENNEFSLWDLRARLSIGRGHSLAKSLQRLVSTSSDTLQRNGVEFLKARAQYKGRLRDFKTTLASAMAELERVGVISEARFENNKKTGEEMAVWLKVERRSDAK